MLSRFFLMFDDREMRARYSHEKKEMYKKALPVITAMLLLLSLAMEIIYRVKHVGEITLLTSIINWGCSTAFLGLIILVRFFWWSSWFVCPILTALIYYYFALIDFDRTESITYFT